MSFQNQSGDLLNFMEVLPASAQYGPPDKSSILTQRRRVKISPQTGTTAGTVSSGTGAGGSQIQFLISDQGGLLDLSSVVVNYTLFTNNTANSSTQCGDDGHPFMTAQALLNGQLLENITNCPKLANVEMTMGGSKTYYQTAGSLQGFAILNNDLVTTVPTSAGVGNTAWGCVSQNQASEATRCSRASAAIFNNIAGIQKSVPLGLIMGLGRAKTYLPIALTGELALVLICGSPADVLFTTDSVVTDCNYSLSNISLSYDVVVPAQAYMQVLQKVAMEDPVGLTMPYESSIISTGANLSASSAALTQYDIIVSRATNHLLRASVVQIPRTVVSALNFPSQSCFGHAGCYSFQFRIGSSVYPQIAAAGDADMFTTSLAAYGSVMQENGTVANRVLWGNSTNGATAGTTAVYETAQVASGGSAKFAYGDRFVPSYGFRTIKGGAEPLAVDGVSLAGASGSQLICSLIEAPAVDYTPFVIVTALRFIKAQGGAVQVVGA